jgi:hypothetical protein
MKSLLFAILLIGTFSVGEIFGDLRLGDKYLGETDIVLECDEEKVTVKTDSAGSFRLKAKSTGKCKVSVLYDGEKASVDIVVFEKPARYRLVLEKKEKEYILKRV